MRVERPAGRRQPHGGNCAAAQAVVGCEEVQQAASACQYWLPPTQHAAGACVSPPPSQATASTRLLLPARGNKKPALELSRDGSGS